MKKLGVILCIFTAVFLIVACNKKNDSEQEPALNNAPAELQWSDITKKKLNWTQAIEYCKNLNESGHNDWRLPNIDEIRTLVVNHSGLETGGTCKISDKTGNLAQRDLTTNDCAGRGGANHLSDGKSRIWSASTQSDDSNSAWYMDPYYGISSGKKEKEQYHARCIREIKKPTKIGNLLWSDNAKMNWLDAKKYCENMKGGGRSDWRLPDLDELRTLVQNCPGTETGGACKASEKSGCLSGECWTSEDCASCPSDPSGKYSKLGDTDWFWSSSTTSDNTLDAWGINFDSGVCGRKLRKTAAYNFRCVTDTDPKTAAKKQASKKEEKIVIDGLQWSEKTSKPLDWEGRENYCKNLKEGGHNDWRLPNIDELRTLIQNCQGTVTGGACKVSEKNNCLSHDTRGINDNSPKCYTPKDCASCKASSSGKYSKLGDTGKFWSTSAGHSDFDPNWIIDFKSGRIEGVFPNDDFDDGRFNYFVRCVRNAD